jgi:multidrug transporter EmrE-like cation transporter
MFFLRGFDLTALGFGGSMALIDGFILSSLKAYHLGWLQWRGIIVLAMLIYSFQPLLFLESLKFNSLTVMNLLWDVMSDVLVTAIGLFYFKEKLTKFKKMGVVLSIISIILLTWKDGDD